MGEKRDREEEERVRPRAAPGALNVNLGNQIKAVFLAEASPRRRLGERERRIRKRGGRKRGRRAASDGSHQRQYPARTRKRRICRARAGGGQSFSALCLLNNILVSISGTGYRARKKPLSAGVIASSLTSAARRFIKRSEKEDLASN